jgi:hypothetical protein
MEVSYFSIASLVALALFLAVMLPRALVHFGAIAFRAAVGKPAAADGWLIAIAAALLLCAALATSAAVFKAHARTLLDRSNVATIAFLFFASPAVLQVLRAWDNRRVKTIKPLGHTLVALAVLSLPASLGVPTAALLHATEATTEATAPAPPAPAASLAAPARYNDRYFTDNEYVNDPGDYPIAQFLEQNLTLRIAADARQASPGRDTYRQIPSYTAFWVDQTLHAVSLAATDAFGVIVGKITNVRANLPFSFAVFLYKLLCTLVLATVTFDAVLRPVVDSAQRWRRKRAAGAG